MAAVTALRLAMAAIVPLAPDETYYWVWSHALAPAYLDHPPMVALWIRAGTLLGGQTGLGVRLLGPLSAALASWFLFDAARRLFPGERGAWTNAGLAAVLLLNGSLLLGVGAVIMTPDTPLLFFWTATLWAMVRLIDGGRAAWWLAAGLFAGLALDSKYTALFLWLGIGLWVLLVPAARPWLRRWQPWAALGLGLLLFSPVLAWNAAHGWAGFLRQGSRLEDWRPTRAFGFLTELVGGQAGLLTPWIWLLCVAGLIEATRCVWKTREPRWSLLLALSLPPVLVFAQHAIGDRVQGNWPAIIYPALALAAAGRLRPGRNAAWIGASVMGFGITAIAYAQAAVGLVPLPARFDPVSNHLSGWAELARQVEIMRVTTGAAYVVAENYGTASELAWWMPANVPVVGTDRHWEFVDLPQAQIAGQSGLLLRDKRGDGLPDAAVWTRADRLGTVPRPGSTAVFAGYRALAGNATSFAVNLPHRP